MKFLFCNIAWMKCYKGNLNGNDKPTSGGSFVIKNEDAHEKFNFKPEYLENLGDMFEDGEYCLGFVETKSTNGVDVNQLNIEKIRGCELLKKEGFAEDVTVVYCARNMFETKPQSYVVGWYRHATVFRYYEGIDFTECEDRQEFQSFNAIAKKEDCVLLPKGIRVKSNLWVAPRKKSGSNSYGFGQSNVWFANEKNNPDLEAFLKRLEKQILEYDGENWIDKYPE